MQCRSLLAIPAQCDEDSTAQFRLNNSNLNLAHLNALLLEIHKRMVPGFTFGLHKKIKTFICLYAKFVPMTGFNTAQVQVLHPGDPHILLKQSHLNGTALLLVRQFFNLILWKFIVF